MTLGEVLAYIGGIGSEIAGATPTPLDDAIVALIKIAAAVNTKHKELTGAPIDLTTLHEYPEE